MPPEPPPPAVVLRIKVRYQDPDAFVERFAPYVGRAGLFLRSRTPKAVGTEVRFELRLADDRPVLVGMGVVRWSRDPDPAKPAQAPGMAIEFTRVTKESRGVILKMLELRRKLSMVDGPRGLPNPPDDDVAASAASAASATATEVRAKTASVPPPVPAAAPQRPLSISPSRPAPAALAPASVKPRRPSPAEIAAAVTSSAPMADAFTDGDIEEADLSNVLARARAMVGTDIDGELAALLDEQAIPAAEMDIEDVSARLASLLGTAPVSRRRKAADDSVPADSKPGFAPPPKVALAITADLVPTAAPEPVAPSESRPVESPFDDVPDESETVLTTAGAPAADPDRTRVVSLDAYAAATAVPTEGATRVVNLHALAASTSGRDAESPDEERTRVAPAPTSDDERTRVISLRGEAAELPDPEDNTLDFDRARPTVPRDFGEEPEQDTFVRSRRDTTRAEDDDDDDDDDGDATVAAEVDEDALTPAPVDPLTGALDLRDHRATTSSGSIDLDDLVSELERDVAPPVAIRGRGDGGDLGRSLAGDALDAEGLIADLGAFDQQRRAPTPPPDGPYLDLASFADPPSSFLRRAPERADSLDATLAALESADDESEERTSYDRPSSSSGARRAGTESVSVDVDDDDAEDGIEIEIEVDD